MTIENYDLKEKPNQKQKNSHIFTEKTRNILFSEYLLLFLQMNPSYDKTQNRKPQSNFSREKSF